MIKYRDGYDGQLAETASFQMPPELHPATAIETEFLDLSCTGLLTIKIGYSWDYASVPLTHKISNLIQGRKSKVPSLVHDALCQLHRQGYLDDIKNPRRHADDHFHKLLLQRGFWRLRAWLWWKAVRLGSNHEQKPKEIREAP